MTPLKTKYGQTALYVGLLIVAILLMMGTRRCDNASPLPKVTTGNSGGDTLDVAILYGPMSYYLYADSLGGLNYDLAIKLDKDLGIPVKLWPVVSLDDALKRMEKGSYDMLASMPLDNSVKQRFLTTGSVFLDRLVLVQLADSAGNVEINSALDLGKDTVFVQKGSPSVARLANLSKETGNQIPVRQESGLSEEYLCMKVAAGDIRLAVVNENTARKMKASYPLLSYDNPISFTQFQIWAFPKRDTASFNKIDRWLDSLQLTPYYKKLIERYRQ